MAAIDEIAIKLGIKTGDLKTALADAGQQLRKFKKDGESGPNEGLLGQIKNQTRGLNDLKNLLAGGAIAGAVKGFFNAAIEAAEKSTDATDTNAAAVREFSKGLDETKAAFGDLAVLTVGTFNKLGAAIGDAVNIVRSFIEHGTEGFEVWARNEDAITATAAAAEIAEKRLADVRKKNGAEFLSITRQLKELEDKSADQKLKGLDVYDTERKIFKELGDLRQKLANFDGEMIDKRRLVLDIAKTQLAADDATLAVRKAIIAEEKRQEEEKIKAREKLRKIAEEEQEEFEERSKDRALEAKADAELYVLQRKNVEQLTAAERVRKTELEAQHIALIRQKEIAELLEKKNTEGLAPSEAKLLDLLLKQEREMEKQNARKEAIAKATAAQATVEAAITSEMERQAAILVEIEAREKAIEAARRVSITRSGAEYGSQSLIALEGVRDRLRAQVQQIERENAQLPASQQNALIYALRAELAAAEKELAQRREVSATVTRLGEDAARRQFGDTLTDSAMREVQDATTRTANFMQEIRDRMAQSPFFQNR